MEQRCILCPSNYLDLLEEDIDQILAVIAEIGCL